MKSFLKFLIVVISLFSFFMVVLMMVSEFKNKRDRVFLFKKEDVMDFEF